jgi:hypothetical protein
MYLKSIKGKSLTSELNLKHGSLGRARLEQEEAVPSRPDSAADHLGDGGPSPSVHNIRFDLVVTIPPAPRLKESLNSIDLLLCVEVGVYVLTAFRWDSSRHH